MPSRAAGYVGRTVVRYGGPAWQPACTLTYLKSSSMFLTDTKSLCRGGPLRPPAPTDLLDVPLSAIAGRRGSRPLRGNFLHALPSHYVGHVSTFRNPLPRTDTAFRLYADIFYMLCRRITSDPSTRYGICYRGPIRRSAFTRTFSKPFSILVTDTKSLRRGGPLCPPLPTDLLDVP